MSLRSLSDSAILSRIQDLVRQERDITLLVLLHLNEIERRRLHLKLGYASLFDYCTSKLGYSASAAVRRIQAARTVARFPRAYEFLEKDEVNVSTIAQVSRALTEANHDELLTRIRGKSQREVETILAEYQTSPMPRDRVRTVVVRVPVRERHAWPARRGATDSSVPMESQAVVSPSAAGEAAVSPSVSETAASSPPLFGTCEKSAYHRNGCECEDGRTPKACDLEKRVVLQFSVHPEFMAKLNRIRSLAGHRLPANASLEQVFDLAMDMMIEKEDPAKRIERRQQRGGRETRRKVFPSSKPKNAARHIPASTRDQVFQRDGGRCTFVGSGGHRCDTTITLQVDHVTPVALGGRSEPDNLRLLCAHHNRLEAERLLGPAAGFRRAGT
jgi:hypothetical protein